MNTLAGLGMPDTSKTDEFSEKFQTAFDPPSFSENHVAVFFLQISSPKSPVDSKVLKGPESAI